MSKKVATQFNTQPEAAPDAGIYYKENPAFANPRALTGVNRIMWLHSLSGKVFDQMTADEVDETLSVLCDITVEEFRKLGDEQVDHELNILKGVTEEEKKLVLSMLSNGSLNKAKEYNAQIRKFLRNPYKDLKSEKLPHQGKNWYLAEGCLDYLTKFVKPGDKRKDKVTEDLMHFFEPALDLMRAIQDGTVPLSVETVNDLDENLDIIEARTLPESQQSIELAMALLFIHDIHEDVMDESIENFRRFMVQKLDKLGVTGEQRAFDLKRIDYLCEGLKAISYKYKVTGPDGKVIEKSDHNFDLNIYARNMLPIWIAFLVKGPDRLNGLSRRYKPHILLGDIFPIEKDLSYDDDTKAVFRHGRLLEIGKKKFPQLGVYIDRINAKMEVAHRIFEVLTANHPKKLKNAETIKKLIAIFAEAIEAKQNVDDVEIGFAEKYDEKRSFTEAINDPDLFDDVKKIVLSQVAGNVFDGDKSILSKNKKPHKQRIPETAPISVADFLEKAMEDVDRKDPRSEILELYYGAVIESLHHPSLRNIVKQIGVQIRKYLPQVSSHVVLDGTQYNKQSYAEERNVA